MLKNINEELKYKTVVVYIKRNTLQYIPPKKEKVLQKFAKQEVNKQTRKRLTTKFTLDCSNRVRKICVFVL